MKMRQPNKL